MAYVQNAMSTSAITKSEQLLQQGLVYQAFTTMNRNLVDNFTRSGLTRALAYLFNIIDTTGIGEDIHLRSSFISSTYRSILMLCYQGNNKVQMQFWAGCLKLCEFRNDSCRPFYKKVVNLLKARRHFRCTLMNEPNHILARYLLLVCDSAYYDMSGTIPSPQNTSKKPEDYYNLILAREPEYLLKFSYILGKFAFYVNQLYLAECFLNMALCRKPNTPFEDHLSYDTFQMLNEIADLKPSAYS